MKKYILPTVFLLVWRIAFAQSWQELNQNINNYFNQGDFSSAIPFAEQAISQAEKEFGKKSDKYLSSQNNLALLYENTGQYDKALLLYQEVMVNYEKNFGRNHPDFVSILSNTAKLNAKINRYDKALSLYNEALSIAENELKKDFYAYVPVLINLGDLYRKTGNYQTALRVLQTALSEIKKSSQLNSEFYNAVTNNLGALYESMGQYDLAISYFQDSSENTLKIFGKSHPGYISSQNNLAALYTNLGQYDKALPLMQESLANTEKSLGKNNSVYISRLNNLAILYRKMGRYDKAVPMFQEAQKITERNSGKESLDYAGCLENLADLYNITKKYDKAIPLLEEAVRITEKIQGKEHTDYGREINNLAEVYKNNGQFDKALPLFQTAKEIIEKNLGEKHPSYGICLMNLANCYENLNQPKKALEFYLASIENIKTQINQGFSFLSEKEKENFMKTINYSFETYRSFFKDYNSENQITQGVAYNIELLSKGLILASTQNIRNTIEKSNNQLALITYDNWLSKKSVLAKQYLLPISERNTDLKQMENDTENLEKQLIKYSGESGKLNQIGKTTWQDIQQKLKPNEVAIEFSSFQYRNDKEWTDTIQYMALVLRKDDKQPQLVKLFTQNELDNLLIQSGKGETQVENLYRGFIVESVVQTDLTKIYDLVWKPLEEFLNEGETIYFAPSETLNQIAFSAITTSDGKYLSDKYDLRQVSTTAKILETKAESKFNDIALFGGINYDESTDALLATAKNIQGKDAFVSRSLTEDLQRGGESWTYLQGTLNEVQNIKTLAENKKVKVNYYTGNDAIEEQFKALNGKKSPQILHIATHGFFFPDPEIDKDAMDRMQFMGDRQNMFKLSDNPLNRSGLLFAGANHSWKGEKTPEGVDDGILTAYEVSNVSLPNTELVVLSACETGLGDIKGSEGVYGLQRSFKIAGAKYLLMSLWEVPDKETAEFMEYFYTKLFASNDIEASYKATQEYMKGKYPDEPYKWAAFVLVR